MSRLYCWLDGDLNKTVRTMRANKRLELKVNYGSRNNSLNLLEIWVSYNSEPQATIKYKGKNIELNRNNS